MAYIPSHQSLRNHPKMKRLARQLSVPEVQVIGHLHCFWWWSLDYAPGGVLTDHDTLDIAIGSGWEGCPDTFVNALIDSRFLHKEEGTYTVHDWEDYGGKYQDKRIQDAARKRESRAVQRTNDDDTGSDNGRPTDIQRTDRQEEKRRGEKSIKPPVSPKGDAADHRIPDDFAVDESMAAWALGKGFSQPEIAHHTEAFVTYWQGESGIRAKKRSWPKAWQTWLLRETPGKWRPALTTVNGMPPEIARLPWNNAQRMKWEHDHREAS